MRAAGTGRAPDPRQVAPPVLAALAALVAGAVLLAFPQPLLLVAAAGVGVGTLAIGPELLIVSAMLATLGLVPFVDPDAAVVAGMPVWLVGLAIASTTMALTWLGRRVAAPPTTAPRWSWLLALLSGLLAYSLLRLAEAEPLAHPSISAPFVALPLTALVTYLWLSDAEALQGLRRTLPLIAAVVGAWCVAYLAGGVTACGTCREWVSYDFVNESFLGTAARVYSPGQNVVILLAMVALAIAVLRPSPAGLGAALLTVATVAAAQSRAQYLAFLAGAVVLLGWRAATLRVPGRAALLVGIALALVLVLQTPVGERAASGYRQLSEGSGNPGYRLEQLAQAEEHFSPLGTGVDGRIFDRGFNFDLGISNTVLALGFVGAALQLLVLGLGALRGLAARNVAGIALASVLVLVLAARPSLPYPEDGNSSVAIGVILGFACALPGRGRRAEEPPASEEPRAAVPA